MEDALADALSHLHSTTPILSIILPFDSSDLLSSVLLSSSGGLREQQVEFDTWKISETPSFWKALRVEKGGRFERR